MLYVSINAIAEPVLLNRILYPVASEDPLILLIIIFFTRYLKPTCTWSNYPPRIPAILQHVCVFLPPFLPPDTTEPHPKSWDQHEVHFTACCSFSCSGERDGTPRVKRQVPPPSARMETLNRCSAVGSVCLPHCLMGQRLVTWSASHFKWATV